MNTSFKLGKIWGIPIGLHTSWFLVFGLILLSLSTSYFPNEYPLLSRGAHLGLALITTLGFFSSVLLHELGHSVIAVRNDIPVKGITLFIFGGVAQIGKEARTPGEEFRVAIAGPLVSLSLAGLFGIISWLAGQIPLLSAPSLYLMQINLMLALFNMIPGFPLDGGRVLRALVWKLTSSYQRATRIASAGGQVVAFTFISLGIFSIFNGQLINGLWLGAIGWFLNSAATSASYQLNLQEKLHGVTVSQALSQNCVTVPGLTTLNQIVQERVLPNGEQCFFIAGLDGQPEGLLTLEDIMRVPQNRWRFVTAKQVMVPIGRMIRVDADTELLTALERMDETGTSHIAILQFNRPVGLLSRDQVWRYLRLKGELGS